MGIQVVGNIALHARPGFEGLELRLWLRHVAVEVIEISQRLRFEACICVGWVVALVVLDVDEYAVFLCCGKEGLMMLERLDCGFCDQDVDLAFDGVESDGVVRSVRSEYRDRGPWCEGIDGFLVGFWITDVVRGVGFEGGVEVVVELGYVLVEMFAWRC